MDVDKIPVVGKIHRTMTSMIINFILLGLICLVLGVVIPFFPQVLDLLVAALLIVSAIIFFNISYNIYTSRKKYFDWIDK